MSLSLPEPDEIEPLQAMRREASVAHQAATRHVQVMKILPLSCVRQSFELSNLDTELKKKFSPKDGPFFQTLEQHLKQQLLNVKWQAYQWGTFIGNHVHQLLQV